MCVVFICVYVVFIYVCVSGFILGTTVQELVFILIIRYVLLFVYVEDVHLPICPCKKILIVSPYIMVLSSFICVCLFKASIWLGRGSFGGRTDRRRLSLLITSELLE